MRAKLDQERHQRVPIFGNGQFRADFRQDFGDYSPSCHISIILFGLRNFEKKRD
jgi:hypothetical protein